MAWNVFCKLSITMIRRQSRLLFWQSGNTRSVTSSQAAGDTQHAWPSQKQGFLPCVKLGADSHALKLIIILLYWVFLEQFYFAYVLAASAAHSQILLMNDVGAPLLLASLPQHLSAWRQVDVVSKLRDRNPPHLYPTRPVQAPCFQPDNPDIKVIFVCPYLSRKEQRSAPLFVSLCRRHVVCAPWNVTSTCGFSSPRPWPDRLLQPRPSPEGCVKTTFNVIFLCGRKIISVVSLFTEQK